MKETAINVSDLSTNQNSETTKEEIKNIKVDLLKSPPLLNYTVALSSSESNDLDELGLSDLHLKDLLIEINRYLLSTGACLAYGGDFRAGGITEILIELVDEFKFYNLREHERCKSYLSFPIWLSLTKATEAQYAPRIKFIKTTPEADQILNTDLSVYIPPVGSSNLYIWARSLTYMRKQMEFDAEIFIGGKNEKYKGRAPGVLEELLIALNNDRPIYLVGGYGGVVRSVCLHLDGAKDFKENLDKIRESKDYMEMKEEYGKNNAVELMNWPDELLDKLRGGWELISKRNGLSIEENKKLSTTTHVSEIIYYLLKGLVTCLT